MRVTHKKKLIHTTYKMDDTPLEEVSSYPYLGVEISKDLNWATHINSISKKANRMLGLLRRNIFCCTSDVKSTAYKALVRPRLEYCNTVWDPHHGTHKTTIERVQRKAARFVTGEYRRETSATALVNSLDWDTLEIRRVKARLTTIHKETHGVIPSNIEHLRHRGSHQSRRKNGQHSYNIPDFNKDCLKYSLYPRTIPEWNLLPDDTRSIPDTDVFKSALDNIDFNI